MFGKWFFFFKSRPWYHLKTVSSFPWGSQHLVFLQVFRGESLKWEMLEGAVHYKGRWLSAPNSSVCVQDPGRWLSTAGNLKVIKDNRKGHSHICSNSLNFYGLISFAVLFQLISTVHSLNLELMHAGCKKLKNTVRCELKNQKTPFTSPHLP